LSADLLNRLYLFPAEQAVLNNKAIIEGRVYGDRVGSENGLLGAPRWLKRGF